MKRIIPILETSSLSESELALAVSLQGLLAQKGETFLLDCDNYKRFIDKNLFSVRPVFLNTLIAENKESIPGYVLFDFTKCDGSLNAANMLSSAKGYLAVPSECEPLVSKLFPCVRDLRKEDPATIQETVFDECLPLFRKDGLIHQVERNNDHKTNLRDYGIRNHWAIVYCDESEKGRKFLGHVLSSLNSGIAIYGWTTDEVSFIEFISHYGDYVVPSDWSSNRSFFASDQETTVKFYPKHVKILPNKHYVAIEVSDGDNTQWLERDFPFEGYYGKRTETSRDYPLAFTIAPSLTYLTPAALRYIYSRAKNETFAAGVSGAGYMNPCAFPKEDLPAFVAKTARMMKEASLSVVTLLENKNYMNDETVDRVINEYAKRPEIEGGVWEVDPVCYKGNNGKIYFSDNHKPFVSVRYSLWSPTGSKTADQSWIDEIADKINKLPIAPKEEEGYSIINVHPWSTSNDDIDYLVNKLSAKNQILPLEDFINLIKKNLGGR
ncbi:MAG: hypothetical protein LKG11_05935 [Bacilli bacterium]|jgi:hypothetical protein|nr:hypothetical protein [Bacilli bacterium]